LKYELEDIFKFLIDAADEELSPRIQRWKKLLLYALIESKGAGRNWQRDFKIDYDSIVFVKRRITRIYQLSDFFIGF